MLADARMKTRALRLLNLTQREAQSVLWLPVSTCVTLSSRLSPWFGFARALAPVSVLGVRVAGRNLLVPGARPWEILFSLGFLFELSHIRGQLGAEHAVKAAFSAALRFYLPQQREMRERVRAGYALGYSGSKKASERQWKRALICLHTEKKREQTTAERKRY